MQSPERLSLPVTDFNEKRSLKTKIKQKLNGECTYCGTTPLFLTCDHIIPLVMGGTTEEWNLVPCCLDCNRSKGHRDVLSWWIAQPFFKEERVKLLYG